MGNKIAAGRASIKDVAECAGVSVGTVSNVLNRPEQVAAATRERVENAMRELRFVRNASAKSLREGHSNVVGVVVLDLGNPFYTELARGIEDRLEADGMTLMLCSSDEKPEREQRFFTMFAEQGVRGVLVTPSSGTMRNAQPLLNLDIPVVFMDDCSDHEKVASIGIDDFEGGRQAVAHLIEQGHRRIGFVNGPDNLCQCQDRESGARAAIVAAGLDPEVTLVVHHEKEMRADAGQAGARALLDSDNPPTAIFCINDLVALGVMRELRLRNLAIPGKVAVVGYDDIHFAAELMTPLSSVHQPVYELGMAAADLLITGRRDHIIFEPDLIERESSITAPR